MEISIIIPVYKVENYLRICLDSVVNQIKENVEVILIDDGSPDNSGKICDEYMAKYPFIKVVHKKNEGVSVARNTGIKEATGKYIMFLDSDDILGDGIIEKALNEIKSGDDIYTFSFEQIDENGEEIKIKRKRLKDKLYLKEKFLKEYYKKFRTFPWAVWQSIYKKSIIEKNNIKFQTGVKVAEDTDFYMQYINNIKYIKNDNHIIIKYRVNRKDSATSKMQLDKIIDIFTIYTKYFYNGDKFYKKYFANFYVAAFNYIARMQDEEEIYHAIKCIDSKIVKSSKGLKYTIFKTCYIILGKEKTLKLFLKMRRKK